MFWFKKKQLIRFQHTPPVTHLLLVVPLRASRSAAWRGPAGARWSGRRCTGGSLNAVDRQPSSSLRPRMPSRWPTSPLSSFSPAGLRFPADATRADEPRSTARVCGGCMLCHRAGVKAGQPAASTSSRMELAFLLLFDLRMCHSYTALPSVLKGVCAPSFLLISFSLLYYSLQSHMVRGLHHHLPKESFIVNSSMTLSCLIWRVVYGGIKYFILP